MFPNDWNIGEFRGRLDDMLAADNIIRIIGDPTHDVKVAEQANNLAVGAENEEEEEPKIVYERRKVPMIDVTEDGLSDNNNSALDIFYFLTTAVQFQESRKTDIGGDLEEFRKFDFVTPAKDDQEKGKKEMMSSRATTKATIRDWEPYLGKDTNTLNRLYDFHKILAQYVDTPHRGGKFVEGERLFNDMLNHNGMKPGKVFGRLEAMSHPVIFFICLYYVASGSDFSSFYRLLPRKIKYSLLPCLRRATTIVTWESWWTLFSGK